VSTPLVDCLAIALCSSRYASKSILLKTGVSSTGDFEKISLIKKLEMILMKIEKGYNMTITRMAGRANIFNNLLGNNEKITLGKNSATNKTKKEDKMTCIRRIKNGKEIIYFAITGSNKSAIYIPYITKAILFPINIEIIKFVGFSVNFETRLFAQLPCSLSKNIFNLLAETKAISIPEKKAERIRVIIIIRYAVDIAT